MNNNENNTISQNTGESNVSNNQNNISDINQDSSASVSQMGVKVEETLSEPPCASDEKIVIKTIQEKKKSNLLSVLIIVIVLLLGVLFMDDIIELFDKSSNNNPVVIPNDEKEENYNLVDGFIVVNDTNSYVKLNEIKFYNFKNAANQKTMTFNYLSDSTYSSSNDLGLYIELYNSKKELVYLTKFDAEDINIDEIRTYTIDFSTNVVSDIKYAKVKKPTNEELNSTKQLICRMKKVDQGYDIVYRNTYTFKNNELQGYEIYKKLNVSIESATSNSLLLELQNEYINIKNMGISSTFENNTLVYNIDVTKPITNYTPLYANKTTYAVVKNNEMLENWECE